MSIRTCSNVSREMVCPGEGPFARAALEEPLWFRIGYSGSQLLLWRICVCLHYRKWIERQFREGEVEEFLGKAGEWGVLKLDCARHRAESAPRLGIFQKHSSTSRQ